jgi:MFS transporter, OFA family, oxalate/formate antiporter
MVKGQENIQAKSAGTGFFYGYIIVIASFFILYAAFGVRFSYGVFFTPMATDLGWNSATTSLAFSISMIFEGIFSFISGGLSDKYGPRVVITGFAILLGAGYCFIPIVNSLWQFYLFYGVLVGVGMGGMFVPMAAIIARWFTVRRTLMTGLAMCGSSLAILTLAPVFAQLILNTGWRNTFLIAGIFAVVVILIAAQFLKPDPASMALVPYGEDPNITRIKNSAAPGFTFIEAVRTRQFWLIFLMFFLFGFFLGSSNVHLVPYAINTGISGTTAALILAVSGALNIMGRVGLGLIGDRIGIKNIGIITIVFFFVGAVLITQFYSVPAFFVFAVLFGFSQGGLGTFESPFVASFFGVRSLGMIFGSIGFGIPLGLGLGPYVTGYVFDLTHSYNTAFLFCVLASILSLILIFIVKPIQKTRMRTK